MFYFRYLKELILQYILYCSFKGKKKNLKYGDVFFHNYIEVA
ncbi:hypothetical protein BHF72_1202 [Cloacibacterium normanense]|uniref:Uncharacterized protein n=1 Tax=Cloacibacterium normanense TaxID=237258 RepID=A0A1E5UHU5_9FLAO|nr:hypothetical protein BHF72_1202 [Cloacibacterium normanense]